MSDQTEEDLIALFGANRLERKERRAFAEHLLRIDHTGKFPTPPVPGAERGEERGGRVCASVGGMLLELAAIGFRPDLDFENLEAYGWLTSVVIAVVRHRWSEQELPDETVERLVFLMKNHWRDGNFAALNFKRDINDIIRINIIVKFGFEHQEVDGVSGAERWPLDRLLEYWDLETTQFADRRGRW